MSFEGQLDYGHAKMVEDPGFREILIQRDREIGNIYSKLPACVHLEPPNEDGWRSPMGLVTFCLSAVPTRLPAFVRAKEDYDQFEAAWKKMFADQMEYTRRRLRGEINEEPPETTTPLPLMAMIKREASKRFPILKRWFRTEETQSKRRYTEADVPEFYKPENVDDAISLIDVSEQEMWQAFARVKKDVYSHYGFKDDNPEELSASEK